MGSDYFIAYVCGQAFLADTIPDEAMLTIRMNIVAIIRQLGLFVGTILGGFLAIYGFSRGILIAMILSAFTFVYVLFRIPQVPPKMWAHTQRRPSLDYDKDEPKPSTEDIELHSRVPVEDAEPQSKEQKISGHYPRSPTRPRNAV